MRLFEWEWSWESKPLRQPWHSIFLALSSLALLSASAYAYLTTQKFISGSNRANGVVTRMLQAGSSSYPRVSFVDASGEPHVFDSKLRSNPPRYSPDDTVIVLYSRNRPGEAKIENFFELWFVTLVTGVIGLALGCAGLFLWVFRRRLFQQYRIGPNPPRKDRPRARRAAP